MKTRIVALAAAGALAALTLVMPARADGSAGVDPVGTWLLTVTFPPQGGLPPFQEFLTFHRDGVVTESNTSLHANSANPFFNANGSDGFGNWSKAPGGRVAWTIHKFVFCGPFGANLVPGVAICDGRAGQHVGYLRVRAVSEFSGGVMTTQAAEGFVDMLIGTDPAAPDFVVPFGGADSVGNRLGVLSPF